MEIYILGIVFSEKSIRRAENRVFMKLTNYIEVDLDHYKLMNSDLKGFPDEHLLLHYAKHGYREGRVSSKYSSRENLLSSLENKKILEIGPFCSPLLTGKNVKYFDVLNKEQLLARAKKLGLSSHKVPEIDYVEPNGNISVIKDRFDGLVSSHNIEHQPDLINHLKDAAKLLKKGGVYNLIIPHSKYCFDASLPLTKISEIFNAYYEKRNVHSVGSVIEHRALTTHNDTKEHWKNTKSLHQSSYESHILNNGLDFAKIKQALSEYEKSKGEYIDVHAWQFTPVSFSAIIKCLIDLKIIPYSAIRVFGPVKDRNEFIAIIKK